MKAEEKLYLAIGEIGDDIIKEASEPYKKPLISRRTVAVAASLALVTVTAFTAGSILLSGLTNIGDMGGNSAAPEYGGNNSGDSAEIPGDDLLISDIGNIEVVDRGDGSVFTLILTITAPTDLPINVYLYSTDGSVLYTTATEVSDEDVEEVRRISITVDGEVCDAIPTEIGKYEITLSFDGMEEYGYKSYFTVDNFGPVIRLNYD